MAPIMLPVAAPVTSRDAKKMKKKKKKKGGGFRMCVNNKIITASFT